MRQGRGLFITRLGERFDGYWQADQLHGEVTWTGRQAAGAGLPVEPVIRDALYDQGERVRCRHHDLNAKLPNRTNDVQF